MRINKCVVDGVLWTLESNQFFNQLHPSRLSSYRSQLVINSLDMLVWFSMICNCKDTDNKCTGWNMGKDGGADLYANSGPAHGQHRAHHAPSVLLSGLEETPTRWSWLVIQNHRGWSDPLSMGGKQGLPGWPDSIPSLPAVECGTFLFNLQSQLIRTALRWRGKPNTTSGKAATSPFFSGPEPGGGGLPTSAPANPLRVP